MTQSIAALKIQASQSYRYWHIYLEYRRRMIIERLGSEDSAIQAQSLGTEEFALLQNHGFPNLPDKLVTTARFTRVGVEQFEKIFFCSYQTADEQELCRLLCVGLYPDERQEGSEILRVAVADSWYLEKAAQSFNVCLATNEADNVYNAARFWALLHGTTALPFSVFDRHLEASQIELGNSTLVEPIVNQKAEEENSVDEDFSVALVNVSWDDWE